MNKRGQFFLIAALIIVAVLLSLGTIYNKARVQKSDSRVYDLSKELTYEGAKVIDSGYYSSLNKDQIGERLNAIISNSSTANKDSDIITIFGDFNNITVTNYSAQCNTVGIGDSAEISCVPNPETNTKSYPNQKNVTVEIGGNNYTFQLKAGQNFYILMRKSKSGETYVASQ